LVAHPRPARNGFACENFLTKIAALSRIGFVLLLITATGCATARWTVKPHQREYLADRIMKLDGNAQEQAADAHILSNREGAIGGTGTSGGGCGCN
jgi:hypothetical protein